MRTTLGGRGPDGCRTVVAGPAPDSVRQAARTTAQRATRPCRSRIRISPFHHGGSVVRSAPRSAILCARSGFRHTNRRFLFRTSDSGRVLLWLREWCCSPYSSRLPGRAARTREKHAGWACRPRMRNSWQRCRHQRRCRYPAHSSRSGKATDIPLDRITASLPPPVITDQVGDAGLRVDLAFVGAAGQGVPDTMGAVLVQPSTSSVLNSVVRSFNKNTGLQDGCSISA